MRKEKILKNSILAVVQKIVEVLLAFIFRTVLINSLGVKYLGISGLFTNIFSILSLMELGIGSTIVFLMYKPINDKDYETLKSLLRLYSRFYNTVALLISIIGILLIPFLPRIINDYNNLDINLIPIYLLTLANVVASYLLAYRRSLLEADQKAYINSINYSVYNIIATVLKIVALVLFHNYILTLVIVFVCTVMSNISIYIKTNKLYPFLKDKNVLKLNKEKIKEIYLRMIASTMHQIGNIIVTSTDNILISAFIGIAEVGMYSNYSMMTNIIYSTFSLIFCSITANIGNIIIQETKENIKNVFDNLFFVNYYMYFVSCPIFCAVVNNLISIWIGEEFVFNIWITIAITVSLYVMGMRHTIVTFINSSGLNYNTRYKAFLEALLNLIISIILVKLCGIIGVIVGTIISFLLISVWFEPYVLFKHIFKDGLLKYYLKYIIYAIMVIISTVGLYFIISMFNNNNLLNLILQLIFSFVYSNVLFVLIFFKTKEFKYYINIVKDLVLKFLNKRCINE